MDKLISSIINYIEYLKNECGFSLSVHFDNKTLSSLPVEFMSRLLPYNSHTNPYCLAVKRAHHKKCVMSQQEILKGTDDSFCRVCHAGVYEYIQPFSYNDKRGFVAISGYRKNFEADVINKSLWNHSLSDDKIPIEKLNTLMPPLSYMLIRLLSGLKDISENEYNRILQFLSEYHNGITLDDVCRHFGRSKSHISHTFKKNCGMSIRAYCNLLKLEDACKLLSETDLSVTEIAYESGFNDTSYFVRLFNEQYKTTPLKYRNGLMR